MTLFDDNPELIPDPSWASIKNGNDALSCLRKKLCETLYSKFKPYADKHFVNGFKTDFYQRFWEMDLACVLMEYGIKISSRDSGPDICVHNQNNEKNWIEAICPNKGTTSDKIPEYKIPEYKINQAYQIKSKNILLRLTTAIKTKHEAHQKYLKNNTCSSQEPYIIAINGGLLTPGPGLDDLTPRIIKAIFEGGSDIINFGSLPNNKTQWWCETKESVTKHNNRDISLGCFLNTKYSGVSAILYSESSCCARTTELGGDFILAHNPLARNQLPKGFLKMGQEYTK